jgi:soluble lytic murein transglycosylase-like protein
MYFKLPILSFMRSCVAVSLLLFTTMGVGLAGSAPPAQAPQTAAAVQQASIAQQMTSNADSAAGIQTSSFQAQLKAVQQQYGVTRGSEAPSDMAPPPEPDKVAEPALPPNPSIAAPSAAESDAASADLAFYSVPWPRPVDFVMPNIQVGTDACDPLASSEIDRLIKAAAGKHDIKPDLLRAVMRQESGFRPCAISTAGAMGLMQIMPQTADDLALDDPFDPDANVDAGARYLKQLLTRYNGDRALALGAYNAGPAAVEKSGGIPPISETIDYVSRILAGVSGTH